MNDVFEAWSEGLPALSVSGDEVVIDCPWCGRPKCYVHRKKGLFHCHVCLESGKATKLVAKVDGVTTGEAERRLRGRAGDATSLRGQLSEVVRGSWTPSDEYTDHDLPAEFVPCFDGRRWRVPAYAEDPLPEGRQLSDEAIIRHAIGYAHEGRYRDRLIVPIVQGGRRAFVARLMGTPRAYRWRSKSGEWVEPPKYLTPKNAGLSEFVYWLDAVPVGADLVVVEGVFDTIRLVDLKFHAVGTLGKHLSHKQRLAILSKRPKSVTFLRDGDATSASWAEARACARLPGGARVSFRVAECPEGHDPDSLGATLGAGGVRAVLDKYAEAKSVSAALLASLRSIAER